MFLNHGSGPALYNTPSVEAEAQRSDMKISVVTISLNSQATIAGTIHSFLSQTYPHKELVVIDGASTDRTLDIVKGFQSPLIRLVSERDQGIFDAMNKGLSIYRGDAIGFLNSNDRFHDALSLAQIAAALGETDVAHGGVWMVRDHESKHLVRNWKGTPFKRGKFRLGWMPPHPTFYMRRSLAEEIGKFDVRYEIAADYDYMLRALEIHAASSTCIPGPLVDFLVGGQSSGSLRKVLKGNLECLQSRRERLGAPLIDAAFFLKPSLKMLQQHSAFGSARNFLARFLPVDDNSRTRSR